MVKQVTERVVAGYDLIIIGDLREEFKDHPIAKRFFHSLDEAYKEAETLCKLLSSDERYPIIMQPARKEKGGEIYYWINQYDMGSYNPQVLIIPSFGVVKHELMGYIIRVDRGEGEADNFYTETLQEATSLKLSYESDPNVVVTIEKMYKPTASME